MKKTVKNILIAVVLLLAAFIYYYVTIPAFNIHSVGTWWFVIGAVLVVSILTLIVAIVNLAMLIAHLAGVF